MKLQDHISQNYTVARPYDGTHALKKILLRGEPVVVKEANNFMGLLTLKDLVMNPHNLVIDSLSVKPTLHEDESLLTVLVFMCENNYDFLPVMRGDELMGVISRQKLFLNMLDSVEQERNQVHDKDQLIELRKELTVKDKFFAIMGHDIKNMFNQVLGSVELLDKRLDNINAEKAHSILKMVRRSAEQVNTAFEGMLLWARLSSGQMPFQPQELFLYEQLEKTINRFQLAGNVKNIAIKNLLSTEVRVFADSNMLDCILVNLIYNAIKFTPSGGEIWISAIQTELQLEVVVVDSGLGMSLAQQRQLFEKGKSTIGTSNEIGAGMGLVICREFIERHGGTIEIESEQGKGTRVLVVFPNLKANQNIMSLSSHSET